MSMTIKMTQPRHSSQPRGKARGASEQHQRQRAGTRQTILEAARAEFLERSYSVATVDAIRQRAGVSRSSFYRHFTDKWAVGKEILGDFPPELFTYWTTLAALRQPTVTSVAHWLRNFLTYLKGQSTFMTVLRQIDAAESESIEISLDNMNRRLAALAEGDERFKRLVADSKSEDKYFARLFMFQFDQFAFMVLAKGWHSEDNALIRAMARHILAFLESVRR